MEDLALMLRSALLIDDIDQLMMSPTDGLAVVWVNISERPDLHALAGRHDGDHIINQFTYVGSPNWLKMHRFLANF